jgi:hypothetical protein
VQSLHVAALQVAALHVAALHVAALHVAALHVAALHVAALHVAALHVAAANACMREWRAGLPVLCMLVPAHFLSHKAAAANTTATYTLHTA